MLQSWNWQWWYFFLAATGVTVTHCVYTAPVPMCLLPRTPPPMPDLSIKSSSECLSENEGKWKWKKTQGSVERTHRVCWKLWKSHWLGRPQHPNNTRSQGVREEKQEDEHATKCQDSRLDLPLVLRLWHRYQMTHALEGDSSTHQSNLSLAKR